MMISTMDPEEGQRLLRIMSMAMELTKRAGPDPDFASALLVAAGRWLAARAAAAESGDREAALESSLGVFASHAQSTFEMYEAMATAPEKKGALQ